jgi:hypothetical protein
MQRHPVSPVSVPAVPIDGIGTKETPVSSHVEQAIRSDTARLTRNGRTTWQALVSRFGGEMYAIAQSNKAYEPQKNNQFDASKDLKHLGSNWSSYLSNFFRAVSYIGICGVNTFVRSPEVSDVHGWYPDKGLTFHGLQT